MIINWITTKTQQFLPAQTDETDELSVYFDFALSAEMLGLLYGQDHACIDAEATTPGMRQVESSLRHQSGATQDAVAEAGQQIKSAKVLANPYIALDEYELALAA